MSNEKWRPGDVALVTIGGREYVAIRLGFSEGGCLWTTGLAVGGTFDHYDRDGIVTAARRLIEIDPESREQVDRLLDALEDHRLLADGWDEGPRRRRGSKALLDFANPKPPKPGEPTDPKAVVTDHRENTWRLLADGDWVCTYGPDSGEYLTWERLATERGPVTVEVPDA